MEISKKAFLKLSPKPGVYIFWKKDTPIYIGKSINLKSRLNSYLSLNLVLKTKQMVKSAEKVTFIRVLSELESLLLESYLIRKHKPKYNIVLKDDKHALYIVITREDFPRVLAVRKQYVISQTLYASYGPFPSSSNVKTILKLIRKIFPYSDHKIGKRACLYSHLGLCNPCPNITKDNKKYMKNIRSIKLVLSRHFNIIRKSLDKEMNLLSKAEKFEEALQIREKIKALDYITQPRISEEKFLENPNLTEDIRKFEIDEFLNLLKIKGKLPVRGLKRIECFDVAHLSGSFATASMTVSINGEMEHQYYRQFRIRQIKSQSDYDSMREVALRRFKHLEDWGKPDLIIVDGGIGQVGVFKNVFEQSDVAIVGLAKNPDRLVFSNGTKIRLQGLTLQLVSRIRDEAHRFARRYHHKLISKGTLTG